MDRALLMVSALLLNTTLGGPRRVYVALGLTRFSRLPTGLVREAERRLNREHRSLQERERRGAIFVGVTMSASLLVGAILGWLHWRFLELAILAFALPVRPAWDMASSILESLRRGDSAAAREALEYASWRQDAPLDDYGVARATIEILAITFSEKIVAPLFWYALFGLPGLFTAKSVYLLQETLARAGAEPGFARSAQIAHYLLNYLPSRLAALLWLAASLFVPPSTLPQAAAQIGGALPVASPQIVSLVAASSALNLSLGGPASIYAGGHWIGHGNPKAGIADLSRARYLFALLCLLLFCLLGLGFSFR